MAATEIRSWLKKFSDPNFPWKTLEEEVDFDEEEEEDEQDSDVVDPLAVDPLLGWQKQVQKVEGGRKGLGGLPEGKVWVGLHCGGEFQGRVEEGKREGDCRVTCLASGIRLLQASYYQVYRCIAGHHASSQDQPEGYTRLEKEDGSWREGFCLEGRWHGLVREFNSEKVVQFIGRYREGLPNGDCWVRVIGNGWHVGHVDSQWRVDGQAAYLYPDLETAYTGEWREGKMVCGRASRVVGGGLQDGILRVKSKAVWGPERREEEATEESLSTLPLLGDPYEERTVEVATSGVGGGGEGLFARRQLEEGDLVAIYNGVKVPLVPGAGKEDWDECGYSIGYFETSNSEHGWGDMDIPKAFRNSESYRATLCHKLNHSFQNNCQFSDIQHPVYGYLPCAVTTKKVEPGCELFVHYQYLLSDCPLWYEELYNQL